MPDTVARKHGADEAFDTDDEAACDDLLMDILSGNGDADVNGDGFLSLLTDEEVMANGGTAVGGCGLRSVGLVSNSSFVKEETELSAF